MASLYERKSYLRNALRKSFRLQKLVFQTPKVRCFKYILFKVNMHIYTSTIFRLEKIAKPTFFF